MQYPHIRGLSEWRPLARGGLALVWQARQQSLNRLVAVKVYQRGLAEQDRSCFLQEIAAIGSLSYHPGIVSTHDAGLLPDGRPYLIMEFFPGGSLSQWLEPANRPTHERVRQVGALIAGALAAAHARGVLHRNVKPANILIGSSGNVGISDFGLPSITGSDGTSTDAISATPGYAPPEVLRKQPATESGDVFSLAATLYALLSGGPPPRVTATSLEHADEPAVSPVPPLPGVDPDLMTVLTAALSNDPAARPSAAEFRDHLTTEATSEVVERGPVIAAGTQQAPDDMTVDMTPRRKGKIGVAVLAVVALLGIVIGSAAAWLTRDPVSSGAPAVTAQSAPTPGGPASSAGQPADGKPTPPPPTATPGDGELTPSAPAREPTISLDRPVGSAKPFEVVRISGTYHGGSDTFVYVQRREGDSWVSFPVPTKTAESGKFTAYIELGGPGRYRLRVLDPRSGVKSKSFVLVIKG